MNGDIVTRLRRHADAGVPLYTKQLDTEAADEIERLRIDLENVRDLNNNLMKELQTYYDS